MRRSYILGSVYQQLRSSGNAAGSSSGTQQAMGLLPAAARWFAQQPVSTSATAAAAATAAIGSRTGPSGLKAVKRLWQDYKKLSKFRLSMLVVATSSAGYAAGSKEKINWAGLGWTSLGTFLCSASANALNQVYEVVNDGRMKRTAARPLPTGRMSRSHAVAFALLAGAGGVALLLDKTNTTTAGLGAANIALYAGMYTPLKQLSVANTWIGAVVGAVPPLMGWAAAAGELDVGAAILAAGLYFWQMPHFMALAWMCRADYAAGGYRMLSLVDPRGKRTAACALRNCMYLFPLGILATWLGVTSPYFAYESALITAGMTLTAAKFYSAPTTANARLLFRASLLHLPIFMGAFLLHRKAKQQLPHLLLRLQPNQVENKTELLLKNLRLLGIGGPMEQEEKEAAGFGPSYLSRTMPHLSLPPMPFLPVPMELVCPSKAICEQQQQHRPAADQVEQQQQQQQQQTEEEDLEASGGEGVDKQGS
ncbi:hypothetical protein N2152v2_005585 [Parachlorella kessleri]